MRDSVPITRPELVAILTRYVREKYLVDADPETSRAWVVRDATPNGKDVVIHFVWGVEEEEVLTGEEVLRTMRDKSASRDKEPTAEEA